MQVSGAHPEFGKARAATARDVGADPYGIAVPNPVAVIARHQNAALELVAPGGEDQRIAFILGLRFWIPQIVQPIEAGDLQAQTVGDPRARVLHDPRSARPRPREPEAEGLGAPRSLGQ